MSEASIINHQRDLIKVTVRIPKDSRQELLAFAAQLRKHANANVKEELAQIARDIAEREYGDMQGFFEAHGWRYFPGAERALQSLINKKYGSVAKFVDKFQTDKDNSGLPRLDQLG
ncbi:MAG: hypothetical protein ACR2OJ_03135 [Hyphomicrobiales bacterium]